MNKNSTGLHFQKDPALIGKAVAVLPEIFILAGQCGALVNKYISEKAEQKKISKEPNLI